MGTPVPTFTATPAVHSSYSPIVEIFHSGTLSQCFLCNNSTHISPWLFSIDNITVLGVLQSPILMFLMVPFTDIAILSSQMCGNPINPCPVAMLDHISTWDMWSEQTDLLNQSLNCCLSYALFLNSFLNFNSFLLLSCLPLQLSGNESFYSLRLR